MSLDDGDIVIDLEGDKGCSQAAEKAQEDPSKAAEICQEGSKEGPKEKVDFAHVYFSEWPVHLKAFMLGRDPDQYMALGMSKSFAINHNLTIDAEVTEAQFPLLVCRRQPTTPEPSVEVQAETAAAASAELPKDGHPCQAEAGELPKDSQPCQAEAGELPEDSQPCQAEAGELPKDSQPCQAEAAAAAAAIEEPLKVSGDDKDLTAPGRGPVDEDECKPAALGKLPYISPDDQCPPKKRGRPKKNKDDAKHAEKEPKEEKNKQDNQAKKRKKASKVEPGDENNEEAEEVASGKKTKRTRCKNNQESDMKTGAKKAPKENAEKSKKRERLPKDKEEEPEDKPKKKRGKAKDETGASKADEEMTEAVSTTGKPKASAKPAAKGKAAPKAKAKVAPACEKGDKEDEAKRAKKALMSRKSSAYHKERKLRLSEGWSDEEAKKAASAVIWLKKAIHFATVYSLMTEVYASTT